VEWVGTLAVVSIALLGLVAAGVRVPGSGIARAVADRILCAVAMGDGCGDEPALIAAYGTEVGKLVRRHMPTIAYEAGSRALPVDFRRCRATACGDGPAEGLVDRSDAGLPVTAFVHVVDCRPGEAERTEGEGGDCSEPREGNLYVQYWTYYADSATLRDLPVAGSRGFHRDDWESVTIRVGADGRVDQRASSHHGYNYGGGPGNWAADAGFEPARAVADVLGAHADGGWGPETRLLLVSGGSHAGNADGLPDFRRFTLGQRVHLVPLEPIAAASDAAFAVSPPWLKEVWSDPEAEHTH
jgi:hypothetical protein